MRRRPANRIIIIIAIGFGLVVLGHFGALRPVTKVIGVATTPVMRLAQESGRGTGGFLSFFGQVKDLNQQNIALTREVSDLKQQLSQDAELRTQNQALKQQLGFSDPISTQKLVPAEIVAYQPDNFRAFITVNRGKHDGLATNMAVISRGALVGKLIDVQDDTAKVFLAMDPDFRVAVLDQSSGATGLVQGQIGKGLELSAVPQDQAIKPGDTLITSGLGGDVPKGLIVGQIETINHQDNAIFQSGQVVSGIKLDQLDLVFVVVRP